VRAHDRSLLTECAGDCTALAPDVSRVWGREIALTGGELASRDDGHSVEVHLSTYLPHSGAAGIQAAARALGAASQQQAVSEG
jgi:hypothetical protein